MARCMSCERRFDEGRCPLCLIDQLNEAKARVKVLEGLLHRAVPLAAYAQDIPRRVAEAEQWHHDTAVALESGSS